MKVQIPEQSKETEVLPPNDGGEQPIVDELRPDPNDRIRELELEKARLEGEIRGRSASQAPVQTQGQSDQQIKQQVWADANMLSDDDFKTKWGTEKYKATTALLEKEVASTATQQRQETALLRAESRMASQHPDFYEVKDQIDELVAMASPEIRQDPEKLAKLMEKGYAAAVKPTPRANAGGRNMNRSRITGGLESPTPQAAPSGRVENEDKDQLAPEYRELGRWFGITSESERKKLMENDYIEMDLGNGTKLVGRDIVKIGS